MSSGRPMRSAIRCATSQCPDRIGMFTCGPSARPRFTASSNSSGGAPANFRFRARTMSSTNSALLPMSM